MMVKDSMGRFWLVGCIFAIQFPIYFAESEEVAIDIRFTQTDAAALYVDEVMTYAETQKYCIAQHMEIARVYDMDLYARLQEIIKETSPVHKESFWLGYDDIKKENFFLDVQGVRLDFGPGQWAGSEPDGNTRENCVVLSKDVKLVIDITCDQKHHAVCTIENPSPKDLMVELSKTVDVTFTSQWNGGRHRIRINADEDEDEGFYKDITPPHQKAHTEKLHSPWNYKELNIMVYPCVAGCCCNPLDASKSTFFKGRPSGDMLFDSKQGEDKCRISWSLPSTPKIDIEDYTVTAEASAAHLLDTTDKAIIYKKIIVTKNSVQMIYLKTLPNREYTMSVHCRTAGGEGAKVVAQERCSSEAKGPYVIPNPAIITINRVRKIRISIPSDENGPISCILMIVKPTAGAAMSNPGMEYTEEQMNQAMKGKVVADTDYIAYAMQRDSKKEKFRDVTFGDSEKTKCQGSGSSEDSLSFGGAGAVYNGNNWNIRSEFSYSIFIVTVTPTGVGYVFRKSGAVEMQKGGRYVGPGNSGNPFMSTEAALASSGCGLGAGWVVAIILGVLLLLVIGALVFYLTKTKPGEPTEEEEEENNEETEIVIESTKDESDEAAIETYSKKKSHRHKRHRHGH